MHELFCNFFFIIICINKIKQITNIVFLIISGLVLAPTAGNISVIRQHLFGHNVHQTAYIVQVLRLIKTLVSIRTFVY